MEQTRLEMLARASNKMRFEYCVDARGETQNMRSIQGHSGVPAANPNICTLLQTPCVWTTYIYHAGSSNDYRPIVQGGLIAGDTSDRRGNRKKTQCSPLLNQFWQTRCDHMWNQHGETRRVITPEFKEKQNSRQTTRTIDKVVDARGS